MKVPPRKICRNCRCPLNAREVADGSGEVEYEHGAIDCGNTDPIDHDGGPINYHCDFCLNAAPTWTFPCGPVSDPNIAIAKDAVGNLLTGNIAKDAVGNLLTGNTYVSTDDWAACEECVPLVVKEDWRTLWARNRHLQEIRTRLPEHFHTARLVVLNLWLEFSAQRTGPPYREPIDDDTFADTIKALASREEAP